MSAVALLKGFGIGGSLIVAIGAQNAFVLSSALRNQHIIAVALVCILIDTLLIWAGVWGLGQLVKTNPMFLQWAKWLGAAFLLVYGTFALQRALKPSALHAKDLPPMTLKVAILTVLALSLLNPHVYLDTVVLLGSIGGQLPAHQAGWFALGASLASLCWFSLLGWGGRALAPWFQSASSWRYLDSGVALTMWSIALILILS